MKVFEWVPNKSIGDLKFNMSRDEARKAMGDAKYIPLDREGADIYADYLLRLGYDHNGLLAVSYTHLTLPTILLV